jgi:hypothetical protein
MNERTTDRQHRDVRGKTKEGRKDETSDNCVPPVGDVKGAGESESEEDRS